MAIQVTTIVCPSCGGSVDLERKRCEFCQNPLLISSYCDIEAKPEPAIRQHVASCRKALAADPENKELNTSVAMGLLRLKQYDHALKAFEKAMESNFDNSEVFFYAAVCLLQGKMPFLHLRPTIDRILSYLESALMLEDRGIYHYLLAYIKLDYFKRKYLNVSPSYTQHLAQAGQSGYTEAEVSQLFQLLGTPRPQGL